MLLASTIQNNLRVCKWTKLTRLSGAVTGASSKTRFVAASTRHNSSRPSFDPSSRYKVVDQPTPAWILGEGLPKEMKEWKEGADNVKRKTWDFRKEESARDSYRILTSAIIPRPIALVSSLSSDGQPNLAPFSYFSMISHNPPLVSISFSLSTRRPKDTRNNILATREFTVNIISEAFAEAANSTAVESPADTDEWLISGLTKESSTLVKPPFVRESAVSMECELYSSQDIGLPDAPDPTTTVVLGLIRKVHARENVLSEDGLTVDPAKLRPLARLGGATYSRLLEGFDVPRIPWKAIREEYPKLPHKK